MCADHSGKNEGVARTPPANMSQRWMPALRILLFDDQYTCQAVVSELNGVLGSKPNEQDEWSPNDKSKSRYDRFVWRDIGLELILCTSFKHSLNLIGEHFDILLLDVDFAKDPDPVVSFTEPSHLGGILLGLCFLKRVCTISQVYTAQDSRLRRDNIDYWYLDEARKLSPESLASIAIEVLGQKNLRKVLEKTFARWCIEIAPTLRPDGCSLAKLVDALQSGGHCAVDLRLLTARDRAGVCDDLIPGAMFEKLLSSDYRMVVLTALSRAVCGHQLVRRAFCKVAHIGNRSQDCIRKLLSNEGCCGLHDDASRAEFHANLDEAIRLFDLERDSVLSFLQSDADNKCKTHTRMNLSEALCGRYDAGATIFGLFQDPEGWKTRIASELKHHLLVSETGVITVTCCDLDQSGNPIRAGGGIPPTSWGRKIVIAGNRTDANYLTVNGGSCDALLRECHLGKIASDIRLVGPHGSLNMKGGYVTGTPTQSAVQLEIFVHHTPATEPN